jgi:hypothetical protein
MFWKEGLGLFRGDTWVNNHIVAFVPIHWGCYTVFVANLQRCVQIIMVIEGRSGGCEIRYLQSMTLLNTQNELN